MLYDLNGNLVTNIPRKTELDRWLRQLTPAENQAVVDALNDECDKAPKAVTSSFIPGTYWEGTPYMALYHACRGNQQHAAFFFGLILWTVIQSRSDDWVFWRAEEGDGLTYFRK